MQPTQSQIAYAANAAGLEVTIIPADEHGPAQAIGSDGLPWSPWSDWHDAATLAALCSMRIDFDNCRVDYWICLEEHYEAFSGIEDAKRAIFTAAVEIWSFLREIPAARMSGKRGNPFCDGCANPATGSCKCWRPQ